MTDIPGIYQALMAHLMIASKEDNPDRQVEMTNMIEMLCEAHATSVIALAGAVLLTAKAKDEADREPLLAAVRELIESSDADFTMRIRAKLGMFVEDLKTPDPFSPT